MPQCAAARFRPGGSAPTPLCCCGRRLLCRSPWGPEATRGLRGQGGQAGEGMPTPGPQASKQNYLDPRRQSPVSSVFGPKCPNPPLPELCHPAWAGGKRHLPLCSHRSCPSHLVPQPSCSNNASCKETSWYLKEEQIFLIFYL